MKYLIIKIIGYSVIQNDYLTELLTVIYKMFDKITAKFSNCTTWSK